MTTEVLIKDRVNSENGLKVVQKGNIIETINKAKQVIHKIDLSYTSSKILVHQWIGYRTDNEFKEITDGHFFDLFKKHGCTKILVDISVMTGTFNNVNDWMATYLMPKLVSIGFNCSAVVLPKNIFAQLSAEQWEEKVSGFTTGNFQTFNDALEWLKKQ